MTLEISSAAADSLVPVIFDLEEPSVVSSPWPDAPEFWGLLDDNGDELSGSGYARQVTGWSYISYSQIENSEEVVWDVPTVSDITYIAGYSSLAALGSEWSVRIALDAPITSTAGDTVTLAIGDLVVNFAEDSNVVLLSTSPLSKMNLAFRGVSVLPIYALITFAVETGTEDLFEMLADGTVTELMASNTTLIRWLKGHPTGGGLGAPYVDFTGGGATIDAGNVGYVTDVLTYGFDGA